MSRHWQLETKCSDQSRHLNLGFPMPLPPKGTLLPHYSSEEDNLENKALGMAVTPESGLGLPSGLESSLYWNRKRP